jgi:hypothetical protein
MVFAPSARLIERPRPACGIGSIASAFAFRSNAVRP